MEAARALDLGSGQKPLKPAQAPPWLDTAALVFGDALAASRPDTETEEERWQTIGLIGAVAIVVVHTTPRPDPGDGVEVGRIISARKATTHERRAYEEGDF